MIKNLILRVLFTFFFLKMSTVAMPVLQQVIKQGAIDTIEQFKVIIPESVQKELKAVLPGVGSGLVFKDIEGAKIIFFAIPDRGMTATLPSNVVGSGTRLFLATSYTPSIILITVEEGDKAVATIHMPIYVDGQLANGLPPPLGMGSRMSNTEIAVDTSLKRQAGSLQSMDVEAIDIDAEGNFWVADEYWPAVLHINGKTGHVMRKYLPGMGLPKILEHNQRNNGFEAIAIAPNGKVYVSLETVLDIDEQTANNALVIRITELDPVTGHTRMLGYPIDPAVYQYTRLVKISDLVAYDDHHFIVIEQGLGKDGVFRNSVYLMNIANASDLTTTKLKDGREVEYAAPAELNNFRLITKKEIFNLRDYGWNMEKMEGLAFVKNGDDRTLAVINDNDFAYDEREGSYEKGYSLRFDNDLGKIYFEDKPIAFAVPGKIKDEPTALWIIHLHTPLTELFRMLDSSSHTAAKIE